MTMIHFDIDSINDDDRNDDNEILFSSKLLESTDEVNNTSKHVGSIKYIESVSSNSSNQIHHQDQQRKRTSKNNYKKKMKNTPGVLFPSILYEILMESEAQGHSDIISWLPDGKAFKIHDRDVFVEKVLPKYYPLVNPENLKWKSFLRQINLYGFERYSKKKFGAIKFGAYRHDLFLRDNAELCLRIGRKDGKSKVKPLLSKRHKEAGTRLVKTEKEGIDRNPSTASATTTKTSRIMVSPSSSVTGYADTLFYSSATSYNQNACHHPLSQLHLSGLIFDDDSQSDDTEADLSFAGYTVQQTKRSKTINTTTARFDCQNDDDGSDHEDFGSVWHPSVGNVNFEADIGADVIRNTAESRLHSNEQFHDGQSLLTNHDTSFMTSSLCTNQTKINNTCIDQQEQIMNGTTRFPHRGAAQNLCLSLLPSTEATVPVASCCSGDNYNLDLSFFHSPSLLLSSSPLRFQQQEQHHQQQQQHQRSRDILSPPFLPLISSNNAPTQVAIITTESPTVSSSQGLISKNDILMILEPHVSLSPVSNVVQWQNQHDQHEEHNYQDTGNDGFLSSYKFSKEDIRKVLSPLLQQNVL